MNTSILESSSLRLGRTAEPRPEALAGVISRRRAREALSDPVAEYQRPTCLLAVAIHELGRTSAALRTARASHDETRAARLEREQEGWSHLYEFTCQRICAPLRTEVIEPQAASVFADAALAAMPATVPDDILAYLRQRLAACASYRTADDCPFLNPRGSEECEAQSGVTALTHETSDG